MSTMARMTALALIVVASMCGGASAAPAKDASEEAVLFGDVSEAALALDEEEFWTASFRRGPHNMSNTTAPTPTPTVAAPTPTPTAAPTPTPTAAPVPTPPGTTAVVMTQVTHTITITAVTSVADWAGDVKTIYERAYAIAVGVGQYNAQQEFSFLAGVILTSTATLVSGGRRAGVNVNYVTQVPSTSTAAASVHSSAAAMTGASFAAHVATASANAAATGGTPLAVLPSATDFTVAAPVQSTVTVAVPTPTPTPSPSSLPASKDDKTTTTIIIVACAAGGFLIVVGAALAVYFYTSTGGPATLAEPTKPGAPPPALEVPMQGESGTGRSCC